MSSPPTARAEREPPARSSSTVVWHELECGSYTADLPLWRELAAAGTSARSDVAAPQDAPAKPGAVLDVGAGSGRVALDLARRGSPVTALDLDAELLRALREHAADPRIDTVETVHADARAFTLPRRDYAVCIAAMQTIQLLGGKSARIAFLRLARLHLAPGGVLACAIVTDVEPFDCTGADLGPSPEIARLDGVTYISRATRLHVGRRTIRIERERRVLAPEPPDKRAQAQQTWERDVVELDRVSVAQLQHEGRAAGLAAAGTHTISATDEHAGSVAVLFSA